MADGYSHIYRPHDFDSCPITLWSTRPAQRPFRMPALALLHQLNMAPWMNWALQCSAAQWLTPPTRCGSFEYAFEACPRPPPSTREGTSRQLLLHVVRSGESPSGACRAELESSCVAQQMQNLLHAQLHPFTNRSIYLQYNRTPAYRWQTIARPLKVHSIQYRDKQLGDALQHAQHAAHSGIGRE